MENHGRQARQGKQDASSQPSSKRSADPPRSGAAVGRWAALGGLATALVLASLVADLLAFGAKEACRAGAWKVAVEACEAHCYTDIFPLYFNEGLSSGQIPYLDHRVEYPVIIGWAMEAAAWVVRSIADPYVRGLHFFDVTVIGLGVFLVAGVLATAYCAGPSRRWTALLVAFSPALILSAFINWDLIAMGLMMLAVAAWAALRPVVTGVLLGLAVATKFYPVVVLWPLFLLCLRAGRMRAFLVTASSAAVAWLAVNLPVIIVAPSGWATFYIFSSERGADWGSIYFFFQNMHWPGIGTHSVPALNLMSGAAFVMACAAIGLLALAAPRGPRLAQLIFLTTAAFVLTNKVWSPQYVVWLVPLVVLARPKIGGYLIWQVAEIAYFYAIWAYLITVIGDEDFPGAISPALYFTAVLARYGTVLMLSGLVVREVLRPKLDLVRSVRFDDPAGGVLEGAPDKLVLPRALRRQTVRR
jgi:Glycosyltransferase family 87